jgi:hypothetical protein
MTHTKDEALKLALEALVFNNKEWKSLADSGDAGFWSAEEQDHYKQTEEAIKALEEALSKQEQGEPFGYFKAEPFGWTDCAETDKGAVALYEASPQRTWVELTDDEIRSVIAEVSQIPPINFTTTTYARAVEAKLKEKNT